MLDTDGLELTVVHVVLAGGFLGFGLDFHFQISNLVLGLGTKLKIQIMSWEKTCLTGGTVDIALVQLDPETVACQFDK